MKFPLQLRFLAGYILLSILGFVLILTLGASRIEKALTTDTGSELYTAALNLADSSTIASYDNEASLTQIQEILYITATGLNADIQLINTQGLIVIDTAEEETGTCIDGFNPAVTGNSYYTVDTFFDTFSAPQLNVMAPINISLSTRGYIAIHQPMTRIYEERENALRQFLLLYGLILLLFLLLYAMFILRIVLPLRQIRIGSDHFAKGDLDYQIPLHTSDEMGQLSETLNYMAGELRETEQFQREFISNISHDFRSPLTSIKGYLEAILDGTIPTEFQEKYLKIVINETSRLTKLTQGILQLNDFNSKEYMLNMTDFDLHAIIKSTAESFEGTCRLKHLSIELLLSAPLLYVHADQGKIQQVLYNLLDNAIKFSDAGSSIVLETTEKNSKVLVSVKDHGIGIPKDSLPKIFDRFYKGDSSRGKDRRGTGLGLAIVKEIITLHKQNINVISTEGVGTEFIFTLSRSDIRDEEDEEE